MVGMIPKLEKNQDSFLFQISLQENPWKLVINPNFFQILGIFPQIEEFVVLKSNIEDYKSFLNLKYPRLGAGINIGLRL